MPFTKTVLPENLTHCNGKSCLTTSNKCAKSAQFYEQKFVQLSDYQYITKTTEYQRKIAQFLIETD